MKTALAVVIALLYSMPASAGPKSVKIVMHSDPEGATFYGQGVAEGVTPVTITYRTTKEFSSGKGCMYLQPHSVTWSSGASAEMRALELCPQKGRGNYQYTFARPDVPGRDVDAQLAVDRDTERREIRNQAIVQALSAMGSTPRSTATPVALPYMLPTSRAVTPGLSDESYRVTVTRKDANLYKIDNQSPTTYIKTRYCYEYVYGEQAILNYARYASNNKLIFDKRPLTVSCDVESVLTESR